MKRRVIGLLELSSVISPRISRVALSSSTLRLFDISNGNHLQIGKDCHSPILSIYSLCITHYCSSELEAAGAGIAVML